MRFLFVFCFVLFLSFFPYLCLLAISYPLVSLLIRAAICFSLFVCICLYPDALPSVVLISELLYQSAAFIFLDGSRVSEGLVKTNVSYG